MPIHKAASKRPKALTPTVPGPFGKYLLLTRLARGGMADVYLAERLEEVGRENFMAIKLLLPNG